MLEMCQRLQEYLSQGKPAARFPEAGDEKFHELDQEMRFLTAKPLIYIANVDETCLTKANPYLEETRQVAKEQGFQVVVLCGLLEDELQEMSETERSEYLALAGIESQRAAAGDPPELQPAQADQLLHVQ